VQVSSEKILENSFKALGFMDVESKILRKRTSKRELYEYSIYATWK